MKYLIDEGKVLKNHYTLHSEKIKYFKGRGRGGLKSFPKGLLWNIPFTYSAKKVLSTDVFENY